MSVPPISFAASALVWRPKPCPLGLVVKPCVNSLEVSCSSILPARRDVSATSLVDAMSSRCVLLSSRRLASSSRLAATISVRSRST
ncbi:hypothetical protein WMF26_48960 [Sorangium sp. So ce185]